MRFFPGSVTINPTTGAETFVPGMAQLLYLARKAAANLPDPTNPKGLQLTADALAGATTFQVSATGGYVPGDQLGPFDYIGPGGPPFQPATVIFQVVSITNPTHLVVSPPVPAGQTVPSGKQYGFQGTALDWSNQVLPQLIHAKQQLAADANADANSIARGNVTSPNIVADYPVDPNDDLVTVGSPRAPLTVTAPALMVVGHEFEVAEVAGLVTLITLAAPGGETIQGASTIATAFGHRFVKKVDTTIWQVW